MDSGSIPADPSVAATSATSSPAPFDLEMVTLPKSEVIALKAAANTYKELHARALLKIAKLMDLLARRRAQVRDLQHRYFRRGPDKSSKKQEKQKTPGAAEPAHRPRGQQKGSKGHGKAPLPKLPVIVETLEPDEADKSRAGGQEWKSGPELKPGPDRITWVLEFRLVAYLRKVVRKTYRVRPGQPQSMATPQEPAGAEGTKPQDEGVQEAGQGAAEGPVRTEAGAVAPEAPPVREPRLIAAKVPGRLIPRSLLGVSIWVELLLWKFHYMMPMNRILGMLRDMGLVLPPGTIDGNLERLVPLFEPLLKVFKLQQLSEHLFHADETFWRVLEKIAEKVGYRWYLWVFISPSVCFYILDPSRSARVPLSHFQELLHQAMLVVDRYSAYKRLPKTLSILLAFCWAHVRRDALELSRNYPELESYGLAWVKRIGMLYHLNKRRLKAARAAFAGWDRQLREHVQAMADQAAKDLADPKLHQAARKFLESMQRHWKGLCLFVEHPEVAMDNNKAERMLRPAVTGRKAFYGSGAVWSAQLAAALFTVFMTLVHCWKINPRHWLTEYLNACADNKGRPPEDLSRFLPWELAPERLAKLRRPLPPSSLVFPDSS